MKVFNLFSIFSLGLLFICIPSTTASQRQSSKCPPSLAIDPCTCEVTNDQADVRCDNLQAGGVTMATIANLLNQLREVNNVEPGDWLDVHQIIMTSTYGLDLTPFLRTRLDYWAFNSYNALTSFDYPPLNTSRGLIKAESASLFYNDRLTDADLGDFLKYFDPLYMTGRLSLFNNDLSGKIDGSEFIPGLSALTHIEELDLTFNNIVKLDNAPFAKNVNLSKLAISQNPLVELGATAFYFDDPPAHLKNRTLFITSQMTKLTEYLIHDDALAGFKRPVELNLWGNMFRTLPPAKFQAFLESHPNNKMILNENPLFCDDRVKWLKDRREEFEHRVQGAYCANDVMRTVFTSSLVP